MTSLNLSRALGPGSFGITGRDMEDAFDRLFSPATGGRKPQWIPAATVWEEDEYIHMEMELPSVDKSNIDLSFEEGRLQVTAKRAAPEGDRKYLVNERPWGEVKRSMHVPDSVDADSIEATLQDGVLHVRFTKRSEVLPRKIEVKTG